MRWHSHPEVMINLLDKANLAVGPVGQKAVGPVGQKAVGLVGRKAVGRRAGGLVTRRNKWWNTP